MPGWRALDRRSRVGSSKPSIEPSRSSTFLRVAMCQPAGSRPRARAKVQPPDASSARPDLPICSRGHTGSGITTVCRPFPRQFDPSGRACAQTQRRLREATSQAARGNEAAPECGGHVHGHVAMYRAGAPEGVLRECGSLRRRCPTLVRSPRPCRARAAGRRPRGRGPCTCRRARVAPARSRPRR